MRNRRNEIVILIILIIVGVLATGCVTTAMPGSYNACKSMCEPREVEYLSNEKCQCHNE